MAKGDQSDVVFSGVFSLVWIGEAVVTLQIKLLGGNMYVLLLCPVVEMVFEANLSLQLVLPVRLYHRLHALPSGYRRTSQRNGSPNDCADTGLPRLDRLVFGSRREYPRWLWSRAKPGGNCGISAFCLLHRDRVPLLHQLNDMRHAVQHFGGQSRRVPQRGLCLTWLYLLNAILALSFHVIFVFCKVLELCLYHDIQ